MSHEPATLRRQLAASPPHVSMKTAVRTLIRALRDGTRSHGRPRHPLASRAALDRCLATKVVVDPMDLAHAKVLLRTLVRGEGDPTDTAFRAADHLSTLAPLPLADEDLCDLRLPARPPQLPDDVVHALLGCLPGPVSAEEAARARHRAHGLVLGGTPLEVVVTVPAGRSLPAVPRALRGDKGRWGRDAPWLPHLDDIGRHSLTPRALGERMAAAHPPPRGMVVDACCGCGGNAVAFALAGAKVRAVELDPGRARMAGDNAAALGVAGRVEVRVGSIEDLLPEVYRATDLLFVDPPWAEASGERSLHFDGLFAALPRLAAAVAEAPAVLLKLPRAFDVTTLPGGAESWTLTYELGLPETGDAHVVRMITASRLPRRFDASLRGPTR